MSHDDETVGRVLSRREALALMGAAGVAALAGRVPGAAGPAPLVAETPSCVVRPEQIEGPYFVDEKLRRSDIRSDPETGVGRDGVRLGLELRISAIDGTGCRPLPGAVVDVWQCDALGVYSDVRDELGQFDTVGRRFLRGYQVTDDAGRARFVTIFPGWYRGRAVHIHFKVRTESGSGDAWEFTSQLYFDDALTAEIMRREPYASKGDGWVPNGRDRFFLRDGGEQLILPVTRAGDGLSASFGVGLELGRG